MEKGKYNILNFKLYYIIQGKMKKYFENLDENVKKYFDILSPE